MLFSLGPVVCCLDLQSCKYDDSQKSQLFLTNVFSNDVCLANPRALFAGQDYRNLMSSLFQSAYECEDIRRRFIRRRAVIVGYLRPVRIVRYGIREQHTRICILKGLVKYTMTRSSRSSLLTQAKRVLPSPAFVIGCIYVFTFLTS